MKGQLFYNNQWNAGTGTFFSSIDPANDHILWSGHAGEDQDINATVKSAQQGFTLWSTFTFEKRQHYVEKFQIKLKEHEHPLAELISKETGKTLWETKNEVKIMQNKCTTSVRAYHERTGHHTTVISSTQQSQLIHKPHGVLAVFGPYNFPGHLPNGHIVPALLAGNTIIFKPSDFTPAIGEYIISLWQAADLPSGVVNLVQGQAHSGKLLANHPGIDGLLFTGSSQTGLLLHQQWGGHPEKILALEMGGNNPLIVDETINDLHAAIYTIIQSAFITSGQRCTCARRLFVPEGTWGNQLLTTLIHAVKQIKIGRWDDRPAPFMGPVISKEAGQKLLHAQQNFMDKGGENLWPMKARQSSTAWLSPGLIDVTNMACTDEEYFGPLLQVIRYRHFESAIQEANNTRYGLSAGLLSNDKERFQMFYQRIRAGIINWNNATTGAGAAYPFGGIGISGNHRPSAWYAADYCAYPVTSTQSNTLTQPTHCLPGLTLS